MKTKHKEIYKEIVKILANSSTCDRAKVGCLILKEGRIVSTGYNGSLPSLEQCNDIKKKIKHITLIDMVHKEVDDNHLIVEGHCIRTVHAEQNALMSCAKSGIATKDCDMIVTHSPCVVCTKLAIMAGIKKIYYLNAYRIEENPFLSNIEHEVLK